jgi:hypothetical protein
MTKIDEAFGLDAGVSQFSDHFPKPSIAASIPQNAVAPRLLRRLLENNVRSEKPPRRRR